MQSPPTPTRRAGHRDGLVELADWIAAYDRAEIFQAVCKLGLEGIVSKKLDTPYKFGTSKAWLKIKNPNASAAIRSVDGTF
jgi:ATP-dependent DNA ligase